MPRQADALETGDFGGDKLGGLEFAGFSGQKTDFGAVQTPGAGFPRETSEFGGPGSTKDAGHEKTHFSEFAVFSAFCTKNGVVTKTGDIGKTFSGLENYAVLSRFGTKKPNELGYYRQTFLTTRWDSFKVWQARICKGVKQQVKGQPRCIRAMWLTKVPQRTAT